MKVHEKTNKQICGELLDEIIDKVISTTKRKHDEDEEDQPMIKKKCNVLDDEELEKRIYKILYNVKVIKEGMNVEESENDKESENDLENDKESENDIEVENEKIDDEDENEINVENENIDDEENNMCEESVDKNLTSEQQERLDNEICENICWCSHHKCKEDDKYNNCMGLDLEYMMKFWGEKNVEKSYKCENCEFDSAEMEDVKKHFMEHHRENYMYKCWKCKEEMKTISQLKNHYEKAHFMKDLTYLKKKHNKCGKKKYMKKNTYNSKYP